MHRKLFRTTNTKAGLKRLDLARAIVRDLNRDLPDDAKIRVVVRPDKVAPDVEWKYDNRFSRPVRREDASRVEVGISPAPRRGRVARSKR